MAPRITNSRVASRNAVNLLRTLFEANGHIVEEVPGGSDFGEDLRVTFGKDGERSSYVISIQVKSGRSLRRARWYSVPVGSHGRNWAESNVPVACVVHDPDWQCFFWANASKQLRHAHLTMKTVRSVRIPRTSLLDESGLAWFVGEMRGYIDGSREVPAAVEELCGIAIGAQDYVAYAPNIFGERMVFVQRFGASHALLIHDDLDREPIEFTIDDLYFPGSEWHRNQSQHPLIQEVPVLGGEVILDMEEAAWIASCLLNSQWHRASPTEEEDLSRSPASAAPSAREQGPAAAPGRW